MAFESAAHQILGIHETSPSRVVILEQSYDRLSGLSVSQDALFRQALDCTQHGLFRAAHVMAWAGFIDYVECRLGSDGFAKVKMARPNWTCTSVEELRETYPEYQVLETARAMGLCTKTEGKALQGLLNKRNECAHPSPSDPSLDETLGYVSELLRRLAVLQTRSYP